jgi:hypothetical protein
MATAAVPDGMVVEVAVGATDSSPSQERLSRIAEMLQEAGPAGTFTVGLRRRRRGDRPAPAGSVASRRLRGVERLRHEPDPSGSPSDARGAHADAVQAPAGHVASSP